MVSYGEAVGFGCVIYFVGLIGWLFYVNFLKDRLSKGLLEKLNAKLVPKWEQEGIRNLSGRVVSDPVAPFKEGVDVGDRSELKEEIKRELLDEKFEVVGEKKKFWRGFKFDKKK